MASRSRLFSKIAKDVGSDGNLSAAALSPDVSFGATVYDSTGLLPYIGNDTGDQAYVKSNNRFYIWDSIGWYNVALINKAPNIASVLDSDGGTSPFALATDGTATTITITATDSDGDLITYSATTDGNFSGLATLSQDGNTFTITPLSQDSATTTSGTITFKATDGINIASDVNTFTLNFLSELWDETVLSVGTSSTNSLDNSTVIDKSSNTATITTSGGVTQSAFHPYLDNWSVNFGTSQTSLTFTGGAVGSGDFTVEAWVNISTLQDFNVIYDTRPSGASSTGFALGVRATGAVYLYTASGFRITTSTLLSTNTWHHVALVRSGTTISIYINGIQDINTYTSSATFSDTNAIIGWVNTSISNLRVVDGNALYTSTFTPPTEKLTSISGTVLLTCQSNRFIDNSTNNYTLTAVGTPEISAFNPFGQGSEYLSNQGLGSGFSAQGSYTQWTGAESSYTGDFTYSFWMYVTSYTSGYDAVLSDPGVQSAACDWTMTDTGYGNRLGLNTLPNSIYTDVYHLPLGKSDLYGRWTHITTSRKSGLIRVYVNGVRTNLARQTSFTYDYTTVSNSNGINLSQHQVGVFAGYIADYKILLGTGYDTETIDLPTNYSYDANSYRHITWDNAGIYDKTGNNTLTLGGATATSATQTKFANTSIYFNGSTSYMVLPSDAPTLTGDFTIEFWIRPTSASPTAILFSQESANWAIGLESNYAIRVYDGADRITTSTLSQNTWGHVAIVRSSGDLDIYINGTSGITSWNNTSTTKFALSNQYIGARFNLVSYFEGYMEDLQILHGVAKYTADFTPPTQTQGRQYQAES